ncbi:MAG TPA: CYTH domain-containing protein, partial [Rubrivivax sp.]|nr:CYTH domain-containing protein [Rubrivivax sp.]
METELKFQIPPARSAALRRAMATASARTVRLQALYADTADQRLAAAGLALRLRKEGRVWVQTLKGRGDGLMRRLEHEVRLPPQRGTPALDPQRHAGTPVGELLAVALAQAGEGSAELRTLYRTDIRRLHRRVRHGGAVIEIAHDHGRISADGRSVAVDEIEFELVSGPPAALPALAAKVEAFLKVEP